jgi:Fic family protein
MVADIQGSALYSWSREQWEPDPAAPGPRRARVPAAIEAYVPVLLSERPLQLKAATVTALTDAEQAIVEAQRFADLVGVSTIAQQLLRSESIASSRIEGIAVPSHRTLAKVLAGGGGQEKARAALANIEAVKWLYAWARETREPFSVNVLVKAHERIAEANPLLVADAGEIRDRQNWIGDDPHTPVGADFIPPPAREVEPLLDDLCALLNRRDLAAVAQAAVAHAQFETIHPFVDGNGRVGRALIGAALTRSGLCREVVPPISLVLGRHRERYIAGLTDFRFTGSDAWIAFLAEAAHEAADASRRLAGQVKQLQGQWREAAGQPRADSTASAVIELLPAEPVVSVELVMDRLRRSDEAARQALNRLESAGVVQQVTLGRRNRAWEAVGLFALVDEMERTLSGGVRGPAETR